MDELEINWKGPYEVIDYTGEPPIDNTDDDWVYVTDDGYIKLKGPLDEMTQGCYMFGTLDRDGTFMVCRVGYSYDILDTIFHDNYRPRTHYMYGECAEWKPKQIFDFACRSHHEFCPSSVHPLPPQIVQESMGGFLDEDYYEHLRRTGKSPWLEWVCSVCGYIQAINDADDLQCKA